MSDNLPDVGSKRSSTGLPGRPGKRWMERVKTAVENRRRTLTKAERTNLLLVRRRWRDFTLHGVRTNTPERQVPVRTSVLPDKRSSHWTPGSFTLLRTDLSQTVVTQLGVDYGGRGTSLQQDFYSKSRHASPQNSSQIYAYGDTPGI